MVNNFFLIFFFFFPFGIPFPFVLLDLRTLHFIWFFFFCFEGCEKIGEKLEFLCCAPTVLGPQRQVHLGGRCRWTWQSSIRVPQVKRDKAERAWPAERRRQRFVSATAAAAGRRVSSH